MRGACVRDIMPDHMITISESDTLSTVEDIMTLGRVRHMPVVHGGKLVGVVSERDLLRASLSNLSGVDDGRRRAFLHGVEIARVMSAPPVVVHPEETVEAAARLMAEKKIGCLPVVDNDRLLGLITETDVLRCFAGLSPNRDPRRPPTPG
jgi:CBS domain-containing protein